MAAAQCVNGPHGRHGTAGPRQPVPQPSTEVPNPGHGFPGPGPHGTDHPHLHQPRPYVYMQPAPLPPLMPYQWPMPMPIPYNPFSGFPGMGYSMVMPPFPPAYLEAPGYVLPQAQLHLADYRRFLHPPFPPTAAPYQNPNRRFRFQANPGFAPKETVSSEVQTEPMQGSDRGKAAFADRRRLTGSDSGRDNSSGAPSSPCSSVDKAGSCPEEDGISIPTGPSQPLLLERRSHGGVTHTGKKTVHSRRVSIEALARVGADLGHCDMWSVCSTDSMVPVCSSSNREDDVMGGGGSPAVTRIPDVPMCEHEEPQDDEQIKNCENATNCNRVTEGKHEIVDDVLNSQEESHSKILKLPFKLNEFILGSRNVNESIWSVETLAPYVPSTEWLIQNGLLDPENVPQETSEKKPDDNDETNPQQMSFEYVQFRKKANESVWSVDSLAPYVPSAEWLIQNGLQDPEIIAEERESDVPDGSQSQSSDGMMATKERQNLRFSESSVNSLPPYVPSASWLADQGNVYYYSKLPLTPQQDIHTPSDKLSPHKRPDTESGMVPSKQKGKPGGSLTTEPLEKVNSDGSPPLLTSKSATVLMEGQKNGTLECSIEADAECIPVLRSLETTEHRAESPCSPEHREPPTYKHIEEDENSPSDRLPGPCSREVELAHSTGKNKPEANKETSQLTCDRLVMDAWTTMSVSPPRGHFKYCGQQCAKLQERNCTCEKRPKHDTGSHRKSPLHIASVDNMGKMASDVPKPQGQRGGHGGQQKWQTESRRGNKAKADQESSENGYGQRNSKKNGQWKNRSQQDRPLSQTNLTNKPFAQRNGPRNGQETTYNGFYDRSSKPRGR